MAEYASIVLICILISILFLGGYLFNIVSYILNAMNHLIIVEKSMLNYILTRYPLIMFEFTIIDTCYNKSTLDFLYEHIIFLLNCLALVVSLCLFWICHALSLLCLYTLYVYNIIFPNAYLNNSLLEGMIYGLSLGLKTCLMIFVFIWARASLPRIRFDQLMSFC